MATTELKVVSGKQAGQTIPLPIGKFLIGREEDCHLRPNSDLVSRHHCVFLVDEYGVRLRDLGSTNGTFINGEKLVGSKPLEQGHIVECGGLKFEVLITEDAAAADVVAPDEPVVIDASDEPDPSIVADRDAATADDAIESPTQVDAGETMIDMPAPPLGGDTQFMPNVPQQPAPLAYPPQYAPQQQYPGYPPQGYPQQYPGYPPQGYPQQYPGYPPQQQYPGYPQPGYPPQPAAPEVAVEAEPEPEPEAKSSAVNISLPDPSETGAPPPEQKKEGGGGGKKGNEVVDAASDIIRQYLGKK